MSDKKSSILLPLAMVIGTMIGLTDNIIARKNEIFAETTLTYNPDSTTTPVVKDTNSPATSSTTTPSDGPIREWSNPPGFKGYSNHSNAKMKKHKGLTPNKKRHKYHPKKKGRCYSF